MKDEEAVVGTWKVEKFDDGSGTFPTAETLAKVRWKFHKDGKGATVGGSGTETEFEYKLDPTADPKAIDIKVNGTTFRGVYELDGDTLTICSDQGGKARPKMFKAAKDERTLKVLKRVTDEKKEDKKDK